MRTDLVLCAVLTLASPASAYIHVPPQTLKRMCDASGQIRTLTVKARDEDKGVVVFEVDEVIRAKRKSGIASFRLLVRPGTPGAKAVLEKLTVGKTAVLFSVESEDRGEKANGYGYVFVDQDAFSMDYNARGEFWLFLRSEPGLSVTYHGAAKELPGLAKAVLKGQEVKVPTRAPVKEDDYSIRGLLIDEALRKNKPTYPTGPLPTAWGRPAKALQAGIRINQAVNVPEAVTVLEVVIRNLDDKPVVFTHLQLGFGGDNAAGSVTGKGVEVSGGKGFSPRGTRSAVIVSPGESYALASLPVFRPGEGGGWSRPRLQMRLGENQVGAEGVVVRLGDGGEGEDVELATGYLDVRVPAPRK